MDSITEMRGATELSLSHKVIAVIMSLILALGLSPIGQTPAKAYADGDTPSDKATLHVKIEGNGSVKVNASPALSNDFDKQVDKNKDADLVAEPDEGFEFTSWALTNTSATLKSGPSVATNVIEMKNGSATLTATFTAKDYNVTVGSGITGGSVSVNLAKAKMGAEVTVTAEPAPGYKLGTITAEKVGGGAVSVDQTSRTFTMPASDVTVSATFDLLPTYDINVSATLTGGSVSTNPVGKTWAGNKVQLSNIAESGYALLSYSVKKSDGTDVEIASDNTFEMPAEAVYVSATFATERTVTVVNAAGGTLTPGTAKYAQGQTVTITAEADDTHLLGEFSVTGPNGSPVLHTVEGDKVTFKVPDKDVTVTATYVAAYNVTANASPAMGGTVEATPVKAKENDTITVTATPKTEDGYVLDQITVVKEDNDSPVLTTAVGANTVTFTMPAANVKVTAKFTKAQTVAKPAPAKTSLVYNGAVQKIVEPNAAYTLEGTASATNVGTYKVTAKLNDGYLWADNSSDNVTIDWAITRATIATPTATNRTYNGSIQTGVAAGSFYTVKNGTGTNANSYTATVTADANHQFAGGKTYVTVAWKISPASLAGATVTLSTPSAAYTGKNQTSSVKSVTLGGKTLTIADYTATAASGKTVGTYNATVKGKGNYTGQATAEFKITQAKNTAKAKKTSVKKTYKVKNLKKKAAKIALPKVTTKFGTAKWKVSTKDKKKVLSLKSGKIQVKKGAKKGTYTIKLKASVAKTKNYKAATTKVVTVKVTVKK